SQGTEVPNPARHGRPDPLAAPPTRVRTRPRGTCQDARGREAGRGGRRARGYVGRVLPGRMLEQATELAPDGVLIVDAQGEIVYANQSMRTLAGSDDLVGRSVEELVPDAVRQRHARYRNAYAQSPTQRPMGSGLELGLRRADGTEIPVEI